VRPTVQRSAERPTATPADDAQDEVVAPERPVVEPAPPEAIEPEAAEPEPEPQTEPEPTETNDGSETVRETGPEEPSTDPVTPSELVGPAPLAAAPLPLATAMLTTIQRSARHSTPGAPVPRLLVRRAPDLAPHGRERVVPVQRVRADSAATPRPAAVTAPAAPRVQRGFLATVLQRRTASPAKPSSPQVQRGFLAAAFRRSPSSEDVRTPEPEVAAAPSPGAPVATHAAMPSLRAAGQRTPVEPPVSFQQQAVDVPLGAAVTTAPLMAPLTTRPAVTPTPTQTPTLVQREVRDVVPMPLPPVPAPTTVAVQAMPTDDGPSRVPAAAPPPAPDPPDPAPVVARAAEPAVSPGPPAGPSGAAGAAGAAAGAATDVEALAQRLFHPMLRRMKAELLLDRERRGMRTDAW
jgi:hypothetical protein